MTCKECDYWRRGGYFKHGAPTSEYVHSGPVEFVIDDSKAHGICMHPHIGSDYEEDWLKESRSGFTDGVFASCDENRGNIEFGEDFGCIHFKPKAQP